MAWSAGSWGALGSLLCLLVSQFCPLREFRSEDGKAVIPLGTTVQGDVLLIIYHARSTLGGRLQAKVSAVGRGAVCRPPAAGQWCPPRCTRQGEPGSQVGFPWVLGCVLHTGPAAWPWGHPGLATHSLFPHAHHWLRGQVVCPKARLHPQLLSPSCRWPP